MTDLNLKKMRWVRKEYDIMVKNEDEETGLISGTQCIDKFPDCYSFSLTPIGNIAYILGNAGQSYPVFCKLNIETLELIVEPKNEDLAKLMNGTFIHTAFTCNDRVYILHNICPQNANSLTIYDPPSGTFYSIKGDTKASTFRMNYSVNEHKGIAYIFGGLNEHCEPLNTVEIYDVTTYRWRAAAVHGKIPPPRHSHVSCVLKNILYIYGGTNEVTFNDPAPLTDMYSLDLQSTTWTQIIGAGDIPKGNAISMGLLSDNALILFWSDSGEVKTSVFNIAKKEWKELAIEGGKPTRRYGAIGLVTSSKAMLLGGFSESEYRDVVYCNILDIKKYSQTGVKKKH